ncbi:MAG: Uma2 family endonuclease [Microcoleaceae cyanobacterium]
MIVQNIPELMTLEEFSNWYPDGYGRYELRNGVIFEMQPTGTHEQVAGFLAGEIFAEIRRLQLSYIIPRQAIVKPIDTDKSGYNPDVIVLDEPALKDEPLWKKRSTITQGKTVKLIIEVVSTNWRDDYGHKLIDYEGLEIPEYWIVDYLGLGGKRYIGNPKQPTLSIYQLIDGEYQVQQFRADEQILSPTFPEVKLTAQQIFALGN